MVVEPIALAKIFLILRSLSHFIVHGLVLSVALMLLLALILRTCMQEMPYVRQRLGFIAGQSCQMAEAGPHRHCPDHRFDSVGLGDQRAQLSQQMPGRGCFTVCLTASSLRSSCLA